MSKGIPSMCTSGSESSSAGRTMSAAGASYGSRTPGTSEGGEIQQIPDLFG